MSYGLYISDGVNGAVITNSNNIFNEEIFLSQSGTVTGNSTLNLTIPDVGNSQLISINLSSAADSVGFSTSGNTLSLINNQTGDKTFQLNVFRFQ